MAFAKRKDMFVRIGAEKAQKPDELITRSQIIPGQNIWFDYLPNYDIRINALTGGGGGEFGIRMLTLEAEVTQKDPDNVRHYATEDPYQTSDNLLVGEDKQHYGTAFFLDIVHNWNLSHKDKFMAEMIDKRPKVGTNNPGIHSLPKIIGVDTDTVRVWVTWDPGIQVGPTEIERNRINPRFWVSLNDPAKETERIAKATGWAEDIKDAQMKNTMFLDTRGYTVESKIHGQRQLLEVPPFYRISLMEVVE